MIKKLINRIRSGSNSKNYQANRDIVVHEGLGLNEVREAVKLCLPQELKAFAQARENMSAYDQTFFDKAQDLDDEAFRDPDVQAVARQSYQNAARTKDKNIHELLSDLVVARIRNNNDDFKKLAYGYAVEIVPKLDESLIKILAMLFIFKRTQIGIIDETRFFDHLRMCHAWFENLVITQSRLEYLLSLSCIQLKGFTSGPLANTIKINYPQFFIKPFELEAWQNLELENVPNNILIPVGEQYNLQPVVVLHVMHNGIMQSADGSTINLEEDIKSKLSEFIKSNYLADDECKQKIIEAFPAFESIFDLWDGQNFGGAELSLTGIAVALTYVKTILPEEVEISDDVWIN